MPSPPRPPLRRALKGLLGGTPPSACGLVLTEPYLNLPALREAAVRLALEDLGFGSVVLSPPAPLALRWHAARLPGLPANLAGCGLVLDAGFSFTHAVGGRAGGQEGGRAGGGVQNEGSRWGEAETTHTAVALAEHRRRRARDAHPRTPAHAATAPRRPLPAPPGAGV